MDRGIADALKTDFITPGDTTFNIDLPNGDYSVTITSGDALEATETGVVAETIQKIQNTSVSAGAYIERTFDIALVDGQLNLGIHRRRSETERSCHIEASGPDSR